MGAIFERLNEVGIGVIIRDHYGLVTASLSKKIKAQLDRLEIEARAMEEGVWRFAWEMDIRDAVIEGDSRIVVHSLLVRHDYSPSEHL